MKADIVYKSMYLQCRVIKMAHQTNDEKLQRVNREIDYLCVDRLSSIIRLSFKTVLYENVLYDM